MDLHQEILLRLIENGKIKIKFPKINLQKLFKNECYKVLKQIKAILEDDSIDDKECFMKIEEIVKIFEATGDVKYRHDF